MRIPIGGNRVRTVGRRARRPRPSPAGQPAGRRRVFRRRRPGQGARRHDDHLGAPWVERRQPPRRATAWSTGRWRCPATRCASASGCRPTGTASSTSRAIGGLGGTIGNLDDGAGPRLCLGVDRHRPRRRRSDLGQQPRQGDRLRASRHARHRSGGQGADRPASTASRPAHAYFNGCSNGGRQALMEVQRYPTDFDGVIAGDPAFGTPMQAGRAVLFAAAAGVTGQLPAGREGGTAVGAARWRPATRRTASPTGWCPIRAPVRLQSRSSLLCEGAEASELSHGAAAGDRAGDLHRLEGPVGEGVHPAVSQGPRGRLERLARLDHRQRAAGGAAGRDAGLHRPRAVRLCADGVELPLPGARRRRARFLVAHVPVPGRPAAPGDDVPDPQPARYRPAAVCQDGGKLLVYHGWADPGISALGTLHYVEEATRLAGGQAAADAFLRTYFVPGMHHCSGGPGLDRFDMLTALEQWVEGGRGAGADRRVARRRRRGGALAAALSASAGCRLLGQRQHRRRSQLRVPGAALTPSQVGRRRDCGR